MKGNRVKCRAKSLLLQVSASGTIQVKMLQYIDSIRIKVSNKG